MTQKESSKNNDSKDNQKNNGQISLSKAEKDLINEIVLEAKKIAKQETSSAYGLIQKTRELLKIEDMQKFS